MVCLVLPALRDVGKDHQKSAEAIVVPRKRDEGPNMKYGSRTTDLDANQYIVATHVTTASVGCPTLASKRVTPHVCRHTAAMELLLAGVDRTVIALWLGHESIETTQIYLDANLAMKEDALASVVR